MTIRLFLRAGNTGQYPIQATKSISAKGERNPVQ